MKIILLFLLIFVVEIANAQIQVSSSFGYVAEGGFVRNTTYTGTNLEFMARKQVSEKWRIGGTAGVTLMRLALEVQSKSDFTKKTFGNIYKTVVPVTIGGDYFLSTKRLFKPFVGLETGIFSTNYDVQISPNYSQLLQTLPPDNSINWGFSPSVGIQLQEPADRIGLFIKFKYTGIFYEEGFTRQVGFQGGITFKFGKKINWKPPVLETKNEQTPYYVKPKSEF